jgi:ribosomal protein L17
MNEKKAVEHMVTFIEEKERQLQAEKLSTGQIKNDAVVKSIIDELERVMKDEDQQD